MDCESCGAELPGEADNSLCRGCGKHVCVTCVTVFEHFGNMEHGLGDPADRMDDLRRDTKRYQIVRQSPQFVIMDGDGDYLHGETLDAAIDAEKSQPETSSR
jgi:hypothetical protein